MLAEFVGEIGGPTVRDSAEATVIGKGVIDGVECDHLAFRNVEADWRVWIESGARSVP